MTTGMTEIADTVATGAGMFGLWDPASFSGIVDYDTWEAALLEDDDIARHIRAGAFVPLNIESDGAFQVLARVGSTPTPARPSERELRYLLVSSDEYLFVSSGTAVISGIEHVGESAEVGLSLQLPAGRWSAVAAIIDWAAEPGSSDNTGRPAATALPDFLLLINPADGDDKQFRTKVQTFDR